MVFVLIAAGCERQPQQQGPEPTEERAQGGVLRLELHEPAQLDPAQSDDSEETVVTRALFEGLVTYDEESAEVQPGVATKWEKNDDATVWTFTLRKDAMFSNGENVTAQSFIDGFNRSTSPVTGEDDTSPIGYHLAGIEGYKKHFGDAEADPPTVGDGKGLSGLKANGDYELEVKLSAPDPEFYIKSGHTAFMPLPSKATVDAAKPSFSEQPVGNGQFMMKGEGAWKHDQEIRVVPNPEYKGGKEPTSLDEVVWFIYPDEDTMYLEWEKGNLDYIRTPPAKITEARTKYKANLLEEPTSVFTYVGMTIKKPPLNNPKVRQAFSMAIDRDAIIKAIFDNTQIPARSLIPPVMPGSRKNACEFCEFNVTKAKQLLQESGVDTSAPLTFAFNTGAGHENWVQAVKDQLQTNLGVKINIEPVTGFSRTFIPRLRAGEVNGLFRLGWGMDYPTPWNFLDPLFGTAAIGHDNLTEYSSPQFDAKIKEAATKDKVEDRIKLYQEAEDIVLTDMPIIPMWFRVSIRLAHTDRFGGLRVDPFDNPSVATAYLKKSAAGGTSPTGTASPSS